jgi:protein-tyrosine phosphatase
MKTGKDVMAVIDFRSHVLPGIDDGSQNVQTSLEMLRLSAQQGVDVMVATPHFYAWRDRVERFLQRRQEAWEALSPNLTPELPQVLIGAEVAFFPGISTAEQVSQLTLQGTNVLLLEMPFQPWTQSNLAEVRSLMKDRGFHVVIAHLERYLSLPGNKKLVQELLELPVTVQLNAEDLLDWRRRGKLIRMFRKGQAHLLGSDSHGIHRRPPNLGQGREILQKKLGPEALERIDQAGARLLPKGVNHE